MYFLVNIIKISCCCKTKISLTTNLFFVILLFTPYTLLRTQLKQTHSRNKERKKENNKRRN